MHMCKMCTCTCMYVHADVYIRISQEGASRSGHSSPALASECTLTCHHIKAGSLLVTALVVFSGLYTPTQVSGEASKLSNHRVRHGVGDITYDSGSQFVGQVTK